jgi:hypothetical protein
MHSVLLAIAASVVPANNSDDAVDLHVRDCRGRGNGKNLSNGLICDPVIGDLHGHAVRTRNYVDPAKIGLISS